VARGLGINVSAVFAITFAVGSGLAGLGGALQLAREPANLAMDLVVLGDAFVVVVVGGMGSISGSVLAAIVLTLLPEVLRRVRAAASPDEVIVVLGAHDVETDARAVRCPDWERGPGASLRCGLRTLGADVGAAVGAYSDYRQERNARLDEQRYYRDGYYRDSYYRNAGYRDGYRYTNHGARNYRGVSKHNCR